MTNASNLYKILKSLSPKEKKYLNKFFYKYGDQKKSKKIGELIKHYEKMETYQPKKERLILLRTYNSTNVAAIRSYLFDKITSCLVEYHSDKIESLTLLKELESIVLLKSKNIYNVASNKTAKLLEEINAPKMKDFKVFVLRSRFNFLTTYMEQNFDEIENICSLLIKEGNEIKLKAQTADLFCKIVKLRTEVNSFCSNPEQIEKTKQLLSHPLFEYEGEMDFFSRGVMMRSECQLNVMLGKTIKATNGLEEYIDNTIHHEKNYNKYNLCTDIYSLLQLLYWEKNFVHFKKYYLIIQKLLGDIKNEYKAQVINIHFITTSLFYQDLNKVDTLEIKKTLENLPKNTQEVSPDLYLNFFTTLSGVYLSRKMYFECLDIHKIYIYNFEHKSQFKVYLIQAKIQEIICYYSLNLGTNLNSSVRSLYRMLLKEKNLSKCFKTLIHFFKKNQGEIKKNALKKLKSELNTLAEEHPTERILIQSFNLMTWLD